MGVGFRVGGRREQLRMWGLQGQRRVVSWLVCRSLGLGLGTGKQSRLQREISVSRL